MFPSPGSLNNWEAQSREVFCSDRCLEVTSGRLKATTDFSEQLQKNLQLRGTSWNVVVFLKTRGQQNKKQSQVTTFAASLAGRVDSSELFLLPKIFSCTQSCEAFPSSCFQSPAALSGKLASIVMRYCVAASKRRKK